MMKKFIAVLAAALMLGGCSGNSAAEISETEIAVETSDTEISETKVTTVKISETTTAAATAAKSPEKEKTEPAVVTPANEVYEVYPVKLIYPEKRNSGITAEKVEINEEFKKDGVVINKFSAAYPVFSGGNKEAVQKINNYIKAYIDGIGEELRQSAENYTFEDGFSVDGFPYSMCGFLYEQSVTAGGYSEYKDDCYDVNGNILSVYFMDYGYGAGAMHGYETPVPMAFDLRTGERLDFNEIVGDKAGFAAAVHRALYMYLNRNSVEDFEEYFVRNWIDSGEELGEQYVQSDEDRMDFYNGRVFLDYNDANSRLTSVNGCVGYYLAPYEYGCYADGIRCIEIPASDILPYLNDEGKALFEGYISAESEPLNVIEFRGEKYFSTESVLEFAYREIDEEDYNFISQFESVNVMFSRCSGIDYERLSELDNIFGLDLEECRDIDFAAIAKMKGVTGIELRGCEFDDISPLYGSGVKKIYKGAYKSEYKNAKKNITVTQWREFMNAGGEYIDHGLIGSETVKYKGQEYIITASGVEIRDRDINDIDYEYISLWGEDFPSLYDIEFMRCGSIDFAAIAKMKNINSITLNDCEFDDISPLYGSEIRYIYGTGENLSRREEKAFKENGGSYISSNLIKPYLEYNGGYPE